MSCGASCICTLDLTLLWLWHRPAATALIRPLACELHMLHCGPKKTKKKKKKEEEEFTFIEPFTMHLSTNLIFTKTFIVGSSKSVF